MKTSTLLIVAGIAVAGYFLYKKSNPTTPTNQPATQGLGSTINQVNQGVTGLSSIWNNLTGHSSSSGPTTVTNSGNFPASSQASNSDNGDTLAGDDGSGEDDSSDA